MFPIHDDTERLHGRPYVNYGLITINAAVFLWELFTTGFFTDREAIAYIFVNYGAIPKLVLDGDILSILTSMFMHSGPAHLIGNMIFLFVFGDNIEDRFGRIKYLLIYITWGAVAAFAYSIYAVNTGAGGIPALGASGAISGVLGAYLIMFPRAKIFTIIIAFFITTVRIPAWAYIPFWFILQIIFTLIGQSTNIAYLAHIGGFAAGIGTGYFWKILSEQKMTVGLPSPFTMMMKKNRITRKERPRIEDAALQAAPEVIEGLDFYEIIAEIRGISDTSDIHATYEPDSRSVRIVASGSRKYDMLVKLPDTAVNPILKYIHYLNGIARIRLTK